MLLLDPGQETVRINLRQRLHAKSYTLTRMVENGNSSFGQTLGTLNLSVPSVPSQAPKVLSSSFPAWTL